MEFRRVLFRSQRVVQLAYVDLHDVSLGGLVGPVVVADELHHPDGHGVVERHLVVQVPALDHAGVDGREVDLAEALEAGAVLAQHVEHRAPLVGDAAQRGHDEAVDLAHERAPVGAGAEQRSTIPSTASASAWVAATPMPARRAGSPDRTAPRLNSSHYYPHPI